MASIPSDANTLSVPVLPLRDVVVYPYMVVPLFVGRERSIKALDVAMAADKQILLSTQKNATDDQPGEQAIHRVGTLATVLQLLKLPDGTVKVLVEGVKRGSITRFVENQEYFLADIELIDDKNINDREVEIFVRSLKSQFEQYVKLNRKIPAEIMASILAIEDGSRLGDTIAAHLNIKLDEKQKLLEQESLPKRLEKLMALLESEIDLLQVEKKIRGRVKRQMEKTQREYYLNEQIKAIQKELSEIENVPNEFEALAKKIEQAGMSNEAREKAEAELAKLKSMPMQSAEATVSRNYLDVMLSLPWSKRSSARVNLASAEKILETEHYGLKEVKERIIEYLAVQKRVKKLKGPILCLVGPPGVGKTSLGQSIANATGRKFVRMSLGGVRDEAEIRGHRRTYIGAMPGKIIQKLGKVNVNNPLFMLDEIDKMSMDFRGDPASALLEVLDPEQNHAFNDHYLEVDYDLSHVMFVATANTLDIPPALRDRMEIIRIPGYTEDEKVNIAIRHLIPKQIEAAGLKPSEIEIPAETVSHIIRYYTREAGVRNLEREISKICRKVVKEVLLKTKGENARIEPDDLEHYLGVRRFRYDIAEQQDQIGQVKGLAWTEVGGELLSIEAVILPGKGKTIYTGQLGEIMQESIQAALSVVRARSDLLNVPKNFFDKHDIHIHVPEGATPKDGPSAGISMCTALVSVITQLPVRADYAMTGEITLRGEVLPIGGVKEKLLAAHRSGIKNVIIPLENVKDLKEIPDNIKQDLNIKPVRWIDEVLSAAVSGYPERLARKGKKGKSSLVSVGKKVKLRKNEKPERIRAH
ncbi:endopeptidase La [Aquicella lusitana]|uniref:Lon protease n=1 Tax=Aquicella lusitana TaxID=254246 RepID=A0A370G835_9COXI|nr:endopeptidase La [Aquicella lusitana]RDI39089.1 ATP-dependent proteinase [Aquicella lusitana]VVC73488.1 Lon protease [Aquicella lusitana]